MKLKVRIVNKLLIASTISALLAGCQPGEKQAAVETRKVEPTQELSKAQIDISLFNAQALVKTPEIVDCTLSNNEAAKCAQITVKYKPDNLSIGPFCPTTLSDTGGIWNWDGQNAGLYRINGDFLSMLDTLGYHFYDANKNVHIVTDLSSRPTVSNACLSVKANELVEMTVLLPMTPKMSTSKSALGTVAKVGLALDGVPIFADAPSVLQTGHMPVLDVCGGHVDPGGWYHWHATSTDINVIYERKKIAAKCAIKQSPSMQFAYAFDGFAMFGTQDVDGRVPADLDECHGHTGATASNPNGEYHYHATENFPNLPACLKGMQAKNNFTTTASAGIGSVNAQGPGGPGEAPAPRPTNIANGGIDQMPNTSTTQRPANGTGNGPNQGPGPGGPPNLAEAAKKLGVSEQDLHQALRAAGGPRADLAEVAKALKINEAELRAALPRPQN